MHVLSQEGLPVLLSGTHAGSLGSDNCVSHGFALCVCSVVGGWMCAVYCDKEGYE